MGQRPLDCCSTRLGFRAWSCLDVSCSACGDQARFLLGGWLSLGLCHLSVPCRLWSWWNAIRERESGTGKSRPCWVAWVLGVAPASPGLTWLGLCAQPTAGPLSLPGASLVLHQRGEGRPQHPTFGCVCRRPLSCPMAPMMVAPWSSPQGSSCCYRRCSRSCGMRDTVCSSSLR